MKTFGVAASLIGLVSMASAHMEMTYPPPFRSKYNPYTTDIDYSMTNPLDQSGSDFPCKGYQTLLDTDQGASVATWQTGATLNWTLTGSATHNGGSCQASLSYDGGATWTAIHSYIGGCPLKESWDFVLPSDAPTGDALFAFTWNNNVGNRELYMNCAHVTIESGGGAAPATAFADRPATFFANNGNGCTTVEGSDVLYPSPGPEEDVDNISTSTSAPVGTCPGLTKRFTRRVRA